jgi:hypothetical protein
MSLPGIYGHEPHCESLLAPIHVRAEVERDYWQSQPLHPADPVEAFIQGRDANTQAWLRAHPGDAVVLATGSDPRRASKLNAADLDATRRAIRAVRTNISATWINSWAVKQQVAAKMHASDAPAEASQYRRPDGTVGEFARTE